MPTRSILGSRILSLATLLLTACASLGGMANTSALNDAETACRPDLDACAKRCETGDTGTCDVITLLQAERDPALASWRKTHGTFAPPTLEESVQIEQSVAALCSHGIERACEADRRLKLEMPRLAAEAKVRKASEALAATQPVMRQLTVALAHGDLVAAKGFYDKLAGAPDLDEAVTKVRVEIAERRTASSDDPSEVVRAVMKVLGRPPTELPGDEAVGKVVTPRLDAIEQGLAGRIEYGVITTRVQLLELAATWTPSERERFREREGHIEKEVGPALRDGQIRDGEFIAWFRQRFPGSEYLRGYNALIAKEREAEATARELKEAWDPLDYQINDIAFMLKKKQLVSMFPLTPARVRDLQLMQTIINDRSRNEYCEAKQGFVDLVGAREMQATISRKCASDPPTTRGMDGSMMKLSNECQSIISNGCAGAPKPGSPFLLAQKAAADTKKAEAAERAESLRK